MKEISREDAPQNMSIGVCLVLADQPVVTEMPDYHMAWPPNLARLAGGENSASWFEAYQIIPTLTEAISEAEDYALEMYEEEKEEAKNHYDLDEDQDEDYDFFLDGLDEDDFRPAMMLVGVADDGSLYFPHDAELSDVDDDDIHTRFEASASYVMFTQEEVLASWNMRKEPAQHEAPSTQNDYGLR